MGSSTFAVPALCPLRSQRPRMQGTDLAPCASNRGFEACHFFCAPRGRKDFGGPEVMLVAHFDDSRVQRNGITGLVVAGYVASAKTWKKFSDEWDAVLQQEPRLDCFHMAEANSRQGIFRKLTRDRLDARVDDLVSVVERHAPAMFGIWCGIVEEHHQEVWGHAEYPYNEPYHWCFNAVIVSTVGQMKQRGLRDKVRFVFDDQSKLGEHVKPELPKMMKYWTADERDRASTAVTFADDKVVLPLQAADMIAWHMQRNAVDPGDRKVEARKLRLSTCLFNTYGQWDRARFRMLLAATNADWATHGMPHSPEEHQRHRERMQPINMEIARRLDERARASR